MTDYDREYRRCESACGEPFAEFVDFFSSKTRPLSVLDLGCGQGRDALLAARHGHIVHGVDIAASGVVQLEKRAEAEGLDVRCEVQDVETFTTAQEYDVVVLDRILHMLPTQQRRRAVLKRAQRLVASGGHMPLADTKRNRSLIRGSFSLEDWETVLRRGDFFFVRRNAEAIQPV